MAPKHLSLVWQHSTEALHPVFEEALAAVDLPWMRQLLRTSALLDAVRMAEAMAPPPPTGVTFRDLVLKHFGGQQFRGLHLFASKLTECELGHLTVATKTLVGLVPVAELVPLFLTTADTADQCHARIIANYSNIMLRFHNAVTAKESAASAQKTSPKVGKGKKKKKKRRKRKRGKSDDPK